MIATDKNLVPVCYLTSLIYHNFIPIVMLSMLKWEVRPLLSKFDPAL